ncbi:MAG: bifunctional protein-serine/threonine kinase/phosphatase [Pseudomonadota bacterium]
MANKLKISIAQCTHKGRKKINQDFHGFHTPKEPLLSSKGIAVALADGISSSDVSQIASQTAISGFLEDYYCTSESWAVKTAVQRVLYATNSWLYAQTRQSKYHFENIDRGYVCTFSSIIFKSNTAHIFHIGDSRIYQMHGKTLEQLTEDHRTWVSHEKSYLNRALGINDKLDIDYQTQNLEVGDIYILATDGIYEFVQEKFIVDAINDHLENLDKAAKIILDAAYKLGSTDNLTIQVVKVDELPLQNAGEIYQHMSKLPFPPVLKARMKFDGYKIIREIYFSSRSRVYLALDIDSNAQVVLKIPSVELKENTLFLERFLMEEWIARRINNAHVLKPCKQMRKHNFLYVVTEYIEGQTLAQWMLDNPKPDLETVRSIIEQIAKGLQAFHRQEMLHQDLRPNNIMIDQTGTVKIIDFGATRVAGIMEIINPAEHQDILGTAQYTAPEYFLGEAGTTHSDMFSLAVIAYQMLSGRQPYGAEVAKSHTKSAQMKLKYRSVLDENNDIPAWIDGAIRKAVHPDPYKRYAEISEFIHDIRHPSKDFLNHSYIPLMEQNPLLFWKSISLILLMIIVYLLSNQPDIN